MDNKLGVSDCCLCETQRERNRVLEKLYNGGISLQNTVYEERNDHGDFNHWPLIIVEYYGGDLTISLGKASMSERTSKNLLTAEEFLLKSGVAPIDPQGLSFIKHHFIR